MKTTSDSGETSLRAAIAVANRSSDGAVLIELPPGEYVLDRCAADDSNDWGDLDIIGSAAVTIAALGPNVVIRQTCPGERVIDAHGSARLTLRGVTLTGGSVVGAQAHGGGVRAEAALTLERATITGNKVRADAVGAMAVAEAFGGGVYAKTSLAATDSSIDSNTAEVTSNGIAAGAGVFAAGATTIKGGSVSSNIAIASAEYGGASGGGIRHDGLELKLIGTRLVNNEARGSRWMQGQTNAGVEGGALVAANAIDATNLQVSGNRAISAGGGSRRPTGASATGGAFSLAKGGTIKSSVFADNVVQGPDNQFGCGVGPCTMTFFGAAGGAIYVSWGQLTLSDDRFERNRVELGEGEGGASAGGGAVAMSSSLPLIAIRSAFVQNRAQGNGGALLGSEISLNSVTLDSNRAESTGSGAGIVPLSSNGGAVSGKNLSATDLVVSSNFATGSGGGLFLTDKATLSGATIENNRADYRRQPQESARAAGAGLRAGLVYMENSEVIGNVGTAMAAASAACASGGCDAAFAGGGIAADYILQVNSSTIAHNRALGLSVFAKSGGGGIATLGFAGFTVETNTHLHNTTLSDNSVTGPLPAPYASVPAGSGAAVMALQLGLEHVTIAGNGGLSPASPGEIAGPNQAPSNVPSLVATRLTSRRSVVIASGSAVCAPGTRVLSADDSEYDWFSDSSCALSGVGDRTTATLALIGPLADNGGPVQTRSPAPGSALIDYVPLSSCPTPVDARLIARPQGAGCDVGAVEATR